MSRAYLLGALHDGTVRKRTIRICQREERYILFVKRMVLQMGARAWTYREAKTRNLFVVEFSRSVLEGAALISRTDKVDYARGYFDAEGGIPSRSASDPYLYFAQKNRTDLDQLRSFLSELHIKCGRVHNPSRRVAPQYWRFYVSRRCIPRFATIVGSWHPRKAKVLDDIARALRAQSG